MPENKNIKYFFICIIGVILLIVIGSLSLNIGDRANKCSENQTLKVINGIWSCININDIINYNVAYAEGYYHSYSTPLNIQLSTSNIYYNITSLNMLHLNNITFINNGVDIEISGHYKIDGGLSFTGGNGGIYEFEIFKNNVGQKNCVFFRSTSTVLIGHAGISCILDLVEGDHLTMMIKDISNPPKNINIYQANLNIIRIDNI